MRVPGREHDDMGKLRITQVRSVVSRTSQQQGTMRALGIKRLGQHVVHDDKPEVRGMISTVRHLVRVEELRDETS